MKTPSTACAECRTLIGGYVLDALEPSDTTAVQRHLADCAACAAEHDRLAGIPVLLDLAGTTETAYEHPPVGLEEAVLDRFARDHSEQRPQRPQRPPRRSIRSALGALLQPLRRPLPAAAAGAFAAAAVTVAIVLPGGGGGNGGWATGETYHAQLGGSAAAPAARAFARLESEQTGTRVWLRVSGLKGNPDNLYELWCVRDDGTKISAGTFRVDSTGRAAVNLTTAAVIGDYHRLSVERRAQPPASQAGQRVMAGEIKFGTS
jgi:hypothetical protein